MEEKRDDDSSSDEESDEEGSNGGAGETPQEMNDSDIIGKLMGGKSKKQLDTDKPSIEEVAE